MGLFVYGKEYKSNVLECVFNRGSEDQLKS